MSREISNSEEYSNSEEGVSTDPAGESGISILVTPSSDNANNKTNNSGNFNKSSLDHTPYEPDVPSDSLESQESNNTRYVYGSGNYVIMSIEECIESVFCAGTKHYLSSALIVNTFLTDSVGELRQLIMVQIQKCIHRNNTDNHLRYFAILCLQKMMKHGDHNDVNELWKLCKTSWDLQPYRNIPFTQLELFDKIGQGTFGSVMRGLWRCDDFSTQDVAIKLIQESFQFDIEDLRSEFVALTLLDHPHIISMHGAGYIRQTFGKTESTTWYIVMDLMKCSLHDWIYKTPEKISSLETIAKVVTQIADGLQFLHSNAIIHRDIKPANILIDYSGNIKIGDLGIVKPDCESFKLNTVIGTTGYMAPELRQNATSSWKAVYGTAADVYSFGLVVWEIFAKQPPHSQDFNLKKRKLSNNVPSFFVTLIKNCVNPIPSKRPPFSKIVEMLTKFNANLLRTKNMSSGSNKLLEEPKLELRASNPLSPRGSRRQSIKDIITRSRSSGDHPLDESAVEHQQAL